MEAPRFHDESLMPLTLGSPYRVADYAYPNWGIEYSGEDKALASYKAEWAFGDQSQMAQIEEASKRAGLGNYPQELRRAAAMAVHDIIARRHEVGDSRVFLEIGSGPGLSALEVYQYLPADARDRSTLWLLDPSSKSLDAADALMQRNGVKRHELFEGTDSETLPLLRESSVNIITAVASVHHHARIPFEEYFRVLKPGGFAVFADWHQPLWEHPGSVLRFLEAFNEEEWPNRKEGLNHWREVYPQALNVPLLSINSADITAVKQIINFWKAYTAIVHSEGVRNELWPLEGHRMVQEYVWAMKEAGFKVRPPVPIWPYTSLLQVTVGQKV